MTFDNRNPPLQTLFSCPQVPWILTHWLEVSKDESVIRSQDFFTLLTYVSWNRVGEPLVWDFLRREWDYLVQRFTLNDRLFGRFLTTATEMFTTRYDAWSPNPLGFYLPRSS